MSSQVFEQSIRIEASSVITEECITDLKLMHRWLNPILKCEPIGRWSTDVGSHSRFTLREQNRRRQHGVPVRFNLQTSY